MLRVVAPVQRGEGLSALLLLINVFVIMSSYYILKVLREPMILLGGGAELKSYASAGQSVLLLFLVPAFGKLASSVNRNQLLTTMQLLFAACLVGFYGLALGKAPIGMTFYLWLGIFNMMVVSNFWAFANDLYTPDQGKRLFPIVGLGGSFGAVLGAFLPGWLQDVVGTEPLFLVAAGGLIVSTVLYRVIDARERHDQDPDGLVKLLKPEAKHPVGREGGFGLVLGDRYLRLMALMVVVFTITNSTGEYVVSKLVKTASASAADPGEYISAFYSNFYGIVNAVSAFLQALLVSRILGVAGIRRSLWIMPIIVLLGWSGFLVASSLVMVRMIKIAENSIDYSLHNTIRQALYLPTSRESKYKAKAAIDTFFVRIGDVIAGIGLVYLFTEVLKLDLTAFAVLNVVLAIAWFVLILRVGKLHDERTAERAARAAAGLRETAL